MSEYKRNKATDWTPSPEDIPHDYNIIKYLEDVRSAYARDDKEAADAIANDLGKREATFKDVEEANAHTIQVMATVIDTQKTVLNYKLDYILNLLVENDLVPEDSIEDLDAVIKNILEKIEKVANEDE